MQALYYPIDEATARRANEMNSFSEYKEGRTTARYKAEVNEVAEIAEEQAERKPEYAAEIERLLNTFSRRLAEWYNENSRIETMCPSILVSGGSNFPVRKKERQNARRDAHMAKYAEIRKLVEKMRSIGTGGIQSGDEDAISKLGKKLETRVKMQETMKEANAWWRKHGTLDGCPCLSESVIAEVKADMARGWRASAEPFQSYSLTNNNSENRRLRERIEELKKVKAQATTERETEVEGLRVVENTEQMRIQLIFDDKPEAKIRDILKENGFRWAPSQSAWQRLLNENGRRAARAVLEKVAVL